MDITEITVNENEEKGDAEEAPKNEKTPQQLETVDDTEEVKTVEVEHPELGNYITEQMKKLGSSRSSGRLDFWDTEKWFCSSQGHEIFQNIITNSI